MDSSMLTDVQRLGQGPAVLLIHGGAEDATMLRPLAESLAEYGFTAYRYDRRGTGANRASGFASDSGDQHADDAAGLLAEIGPATVVGFSSGGVVALALAARRPDAAREIIAWEPAALGMLPDGEAIHASILAPVDAYLAEHPDDWRGAWRTALTVMSGGAADLESPHLRATLANAEAVIRDDARLLTRRRFEPGELPSDGLVTIATGARPSPLHAEIAARLGELVGRPPVAVRHADDHETYLIEPPVIASWLAARVPA
jgi:pimeloyl-ACP methyl ester carboxylesterase